MMTRAAESPHEEKGEFRQLLSYTIPGYASGILLAAALDHFGLQRSGIGQWLVRTLSGEGESLFEGAFAVRQRLRRASVSMAEAYGWGKLVGMAAPWVIDWFSRALGVNVYGVEGFYIPYFYALSDQIGANVSGLLFLRRQQGTWPNAAARYARDPVMLASLAVILLVPVGLLLARVAGFSPTTQLYTAFETMAANLCWIPPVVGWLAERREASGGERGPS
jgi:hypothetical protein